jgi:predicted nucleic acid-binding protein
MSNVTTILLDTTVLIDALRRRNRRNELLVEWLSSGHSLATSTVNIAEVYDGIHPGEEDATHAVLAELEWFPVSGAIAKRAGHLQATLRRQGQTRGIADMIVAATALENGFPVATENRKDFKVEGLTLLPLP